jgi:hypothetical protein
MTVNYAQKAQTAKTLISRFGNGQVCTINYDGVDYPNIAYVKITYDLKLVGQVFAAGDILIYTEGLSFDPVPDRDKCYIDGLAYKIVGPVQKLEPTNIAIYHQLILRR